MEYNSFDLIFPEYQSCKEKKNTQNCRAFKNP